VFQNSFSLNFLTPFFVETLSYTTVQNFGVC